MRYTRTIWYDNGKSIWCDFITLKCRDSFTSTWRKTPTKHNERLMLSFFYILYSPLQWLHALHVFNIHTTMTSKPEKNHINITHMIFVFSCFVAFLFKRIYINKQFSISIYFAHTRVLLFLHVYTKYTRKNHFYVYL